MKNLRPLTQGAFQEEVFRELRKQAQKIEILEEIVRAQTGLSPEDFQKAMRTAGELLKCPLEGL